MLAKRRLGVLADLIGYGPLAFGGRMEVDECGPLGDNFRLLVVIERQFIYVEDFELPRWPAR